MPAIQTSELQMDRDIHLLRRVFPDVTIEDFVIGKGPRVIGREPPSRGIGIRDSEASREHASIALNGDAVWLEDLKSTNGTFVNDQRVERTRLYDQDLIQIGRSLFVYTKHTMKFGDDVIINQGEVSIARAQVENYARTVADSDISVLITGPTGAGKEHLAALVHESSGRMGPIITVNCGAIPPNLIASELFGHKKGSFSGATTDRQGLFRSAQGGTLFLDEVAELPLEVQANLLRVCETKEVRPVGSDTVFKVDVRLVSATLAPLEARVKSGDFRADLLARLRGVTLTLPPLRSRRDEILALFRRFCGPRDFGLTVAKRLLLNDWVENVRGLKGAAEHALLFCPADGPLRASDLPENMRRSVAETPGRRLDGDDESRDELLQRLLTETDGNVAEVARRMGVHRQQVYRWMKRAQIER